MSLVKSCSFIVGPEIQAGSKTLLYGYYSMAQADENVGVDTNGQANRFRHCRFDSLPITK